MSQNETILLVVGILLFMGIQLLTSILIYRDSKKKGFSPVWWVSLNFILPLIGMLIYYVVNYDRPQVAPWVIALSGVALFLVIGIAVILFSGGKNEPIPAPVLGVIMVLPTPTATLTPPPITPSPSPVITPTPTIEVKGPLLIKGEPDGAEFTIEKNGVVIEKGNIPISVTKPVGSYKVVVKKNGFITYIETINIQAGIDSEINVVLKKKETSPVLYTNTVTDMEFVFVKGGCYQMGDTFGDGEAVEKPVYKVCVDDFYLGKYEVTNAQFKKFVADIGYRTEAERENKGYGISGDGMNDWGWKSGLNWKHPIYPSDDVSSKMNHPVVQVSWNDAKEYISWLNQKTGKRYSLPTEAEWEYACRNGEKSDKYSWGNNLPSGNIADEALKAKYPDWKIWTGYNDGYVYTAPVGSYKVSEAGLYDMSGNVWEWVEDVYAADAYSKHSRNNPIYTGSGERRVYRGGGWSRNPQDVRCSYRNYGTPGGRYSNLGFRLKYVK